MKIFLIIAAAVVSVCMVVPAPRQTYHTALCRKHISHLAPHLSELSVLVKKTPLDTAGPVSAYTVDFSTVRGGNGNGRLIIFHHAPGYGSFRHIHSADAVTYDFSRYAVTQAAVDRSRQQGRNVELKPFSAPSLSDFIAGESGHGAEIFFAVNGHFSGGYHPNFLVIENGVLIKRQAPGIMQTKTEGPSGRFSFFVFQWNDPQKKPGIIELDITGGTLTPEGAALAAEAAAAVHTPMILRKTDNGRTVRDMPVFELPCVQPQSVTFKDDAGFCFTIAGLTHEGELAFLTMTGTLTITDAQTLAESLGFASAGLLGISGDAQQHVEGLPDIIGYARAGTTITSSGSRPLGSIVFYQSFAGIETMEQLILARSV